MIVSVFVVHEGCSSLLLALLQIANRVGPLEVVADAINSPDTS
jgi:hypothetical protein